MSSEEEKREVSATLPLRCPDCGYDNPVPAPIDRHKLYECDRCTYRFSLGGS